MTSWRRQWQSSVDSEDQRTAMVFGFFKHAPPEHGLRPWLAEITGADVEVDALDEGAFWPWHVDSTRRVVPDLCFPAVIAGEPTVVVVEAKRTTESHPLGQLVAEARTAAAKHSTRTVRVITVGSGLSSLSRTAELQDRLPELAVQHHHSPWALLGGVLAAVPAPWDHYAGDIVERMRRLGLLNEPGRPDMAIEPRDVVLAINQLTASARDFLKRVDADIARPLGCSLPRGRPIWRTGISESPDASAIWWTQGVIYGSWSRTDWPDERRVFVAIDLTLDAGPAILIGPAWAANGRLTHLMLEGDEGDTTRNTTLDVRAVAFEHRRACRGDTRVRDFRFNARPWSDDAAGDLQWAAREFAVAVEVAEAVHDEWTSSEGE